MNPIVIVVVLVVLLIAIGVGAYFYVTKSSASPLKEGPVATPYVPPQVVAPAPVAKPTPADITYNNPTTFNPDAGPADVAPVVPVAAPVVAPTLSGPGGNCPCDPKLAWCGPDNKCYETCYASGRCAGNDVPRKNIYSCDYDACKLSGVGGNCPCDPNVAWCGPDNKCYETCVNRGRCAGNDVPRQNTYSCDYSNC